MTTWVTVLMIIGILAALLGLCAVTIRVQQKYPSEQYDERQKQVRGEAYRLAFWLGTVYYLLIALMIGIERIDSELIFQLLIAGVLGQFMVLNFYCFMTYASLPVSKNSMSSVVCFFALGVMYLVEHFVVLQSWIPLATGICFLTMAALHLINIIRQNKE